MPEEQSSPSIGALITSAVAGLPAALSKSALGALNRLVAGTADIPATYLAGLKEGLEDRNYERRRLRRALADAAATQASADEQLVERTIERLINEQTRKQHNREAIANGTAILLTTASSKEEAAPAESIDEDWLNSFEKFAEDASSDRMRDLWSRVLAGEIIKPGSFGRKTLRFLHELDKPTAEAFEEVAQYVLGRHVFAGEEVPDGMFGKMLHLEALGALSGSAGLIHYQARADSSGRFAISGKGHSLVGLTEPDKTVLITATPLTQVGQEILKIVPNKDEVKTIIRLAEELKADTPFSGAKAKGVALATVVGSNAKLVRVLWGDSPFGKTPVNANA